MYSHTHTNIYICLLYIYHTYNIIYINAPLLSLDEILIFYIYLNNFFQKINVILGLKYEKKKRNIIINRILFTHFDI